MNTWIVTVCDCVWPELPPLVAFTVNVYVPGRVARSVQCPQPEICIAPAAIASMNSPRIQRRRPGTQNANSPAIAASASERSPKPPPFEPRKYGWELLQSCGADVATNRVVARLVTAMNLCRSAWGASGERAEREGRDSIPGLYPHEIEIRH